MAGTVIRMWCGGCLWGVVRWLLGWWLTEVTAQIVYSHLCESHDDVCVYIRGSVCAAQTSVVALVLFVNGLVLEAAHDCRETRAALVYLFKCTTGSHLWQRVRVCVCAFIDTRCNIHSAQKTDIKPGFRVHIPHMNTALYGIFQY